MRQKMNQRARPKNLNLLTIRLPINAVVSILHRLSGLVLFLVLPLLLVAFQLAATRESGYLTLLGWLQSWPVKCLLTVISWAFFHHFYAGLRHLGQDIHWMTSLNKARFSSRVVLGLVAVSVLLSCMVIWW